MHVPYLRYTGLDMGHAWVFCGFPERLTSAGSCQTCPVHAPFIRQKHALILRVEFS